MLKCDDCNKALNEDSDYCYCMSCHDDLRYELKDAKDLLKDKDNEIDKLQDRIEWLEEIILDLKNEYE